MCKKFGEGVVVQMNQTVMAHDCFSTGALTVDLALGGGLPHGRIIEIFGPEQSGKTTLALHAIASIQKKGGHCAFIDAECALDLEYAVVLGVDTDKWDLYNPASAEQGTDIAVEAAEKGVYDLIVIDSVAALVPEAELENEMGKMTMGLLARLMSKFMRKITSLLARTNTTLLLINQLRANIGGYGPPEVTPGGNAIKYAATVRLMVRSPKSGLMGPAESPRQIRVKVTVQKNKLAAPHRTGEFDIVFGKGISWESSVLEAGVNKQVVGQAGAWLSFNGYREQGREKFTNFLRNHPEVTDEIERLVRSGEAPEETRKPEEVEPEETSKPE